MHSIMADSLKVYDILTAAQIPDSQARAITAAIKESESAIALDVRAVLDEKLEHLATKADLAELRVEISGNKGELRGEMGEIKAELMRWMFVFWIGQVAAMVGIVKLWK